MGKFFITGSPGAGKSSVVKKLQDRGYTAHDTDSLEGVTRLEDKKGNHMPWPTGPIDWNIYEWNWSVSAIKKLLDSAEDVFLGGVANNQSDFYDDFDKIFVLYIPPDVLRHRLLSRTEKDYGKDPVQLAEELAYKEEREAGMLAHPSSIKIDATPPLNDIADKILELVQLSREN